MLSRLLCARILSILFIYLMVSAIASAGAGMEIESCSDEIGGLQSSEMHIHSVRNSGTFGRKGIMVPLTNLPFLSSSSVFGVFGSSKSIIMA